MDDSYRMLGLLSSQTQERNSKTTTRLTVKSKQEAAAATKPALKNTFTYLVESLTLSYILISQIKINMIQNQQEISKGNSTGPNVSFQLILLFVDENTVVDIGYWYLCSSIHTPLWKVCPRKDKTMNKVLQIARLLA